MALQNWDIPSLLSISIDGTIQFPNIRALLDKDMRVLYTKDKSEKKEVFMKELGVVYYLGDPTSPANERGLQFNEALKLAIENFDLPKDYTCDATVMRLVDKVYNEKITEAGKTILLIKKALHTETLMADKLQNLLTELIQGAVTQEDISTAADHAKTINEIVTRIPALLSSLDKAYENLIREKETSLARGKTEITSSMDATAANYL